MGERDRERQRETVRENERERDRERWDKGAGLDCLEANHGQR